MKYAIIALFILIVSGCTKDKSEIVEINKLRGNWVETKKITDTLSFTILLEDKEVMILKRAELYRSGPYEYKLLPNNQISIHWMLAGSMAFSDYSFSVSGDELTIGNFYDSPSGAILTFKKIN